MLEPAPSDKPVRSADIPRAPRIRQEGGQPSGTGRRDGFSSLRYPASAHRHVRYFVIWQGDDRRSSQQIRSLPHAHRRRYDAPIAAAGVSLRRVAADRGLGAADRLLVDRGAEFMGDKVGAARRGCMAHRLIKRATPRVAPLAIGLTSVLADSRESGLGRPPVRRPCDKAARIRDSG
jgi:hypothetical protein